MNRQIDGYNDHYSVFLNCAEKSAKQACLDNGNIFKNLKINSEGHKFL